MLKLFRDSKHKIQLAADETLFDEGDEGDTMYVVLSGRISVQIDGDEVDAVLPGGILGEMALVDSRPRSASAVASEPTEIVSIDRERFGNIVQLVPNFALHILSVNTQRLRRLMRLIG
jgi:CRP-like cAMP-binding protein